MSRISEERIAVIVIDCSTSMAGPMDGGRNKTDPNGNNPERWTLVWARLKSVVEKLSSASPGIEVNIRFFAETVDCLPPLKQVVRSQEDVSLLMAQIPRAAPSKGRTALYGALYAALSELNKRPSNGSFDWVYFAVISDGEDTKSQERVGDFKRALSSLRTALGTRLAVQAAIVGSEAKDFADKGGFGEMSAVGIENLIPVPPKPRPRFRLELAPPAQTLQAGQVAAPGAQAEIKGSIAQFPHLAHPGLELVATLSGSGGIPPSRTTLTPSPAGEWKLQFQMPNDAARGVSGLLTIKASSRGGSDVDFEGEVVVPISFPASQTLSSDKWILDHQPFVRRGADASFSAAVGKSKSIAWDFAPPKGGPPIRAEGSSCTVAFPVAGSWKVTVAVTGDDGRIQTKGTKLEVVDCDFSIEAPKESIVANSPPTFTVKPTADGVSEATYTASLDGVPATVSERGVAAEVLTAGSHALTVVATSKVGGFTWTHTLEFKADVAPTLQILGPRTILEGAGPTDVDLYWAGSIGKSINATFGGGNTPPIPVVYPSEGPSVGQVSLRVDPKAFVTRTQPLEVSGSDRADVKDRADLELRSANLVVQLVNPPDGAAVKGDGTAEITIGITGEDRAQVSDPSVDIRFTDESGVTKKVTATNASGWKARIPVGLRPGEVRIEAQLGGGSLRTDLFPRTWERIGEYSIAPPQIQIVQIPGTGGRSALPGKQVTLGVEGVPAAEVASHRWTAAPPSGPSVESVESTIRVIPQAWGNMPVTVELTLRNGAVVKASETLSVAGETPSVNPELSNNTPTLSDASILVKPNVKGSSTSVRARLWPCNRDGTRSSAEPAWESAELDPGTATIDVPLSGDKLRMPVADFEVEVVVAPFAGDPSGGAISAKRSGRVVPSPLWHWWIACVLAFLAATWLLWKWLRGNEPINWEIGYSFKDPGPASDESFGAMSVVRVRESRRSPDQSLPPYRGWSRRRKEAFVPLWYLKDRTDDIDGEWLGEADYARLNLHVTNFWAQPFYRVPGADQGWAEAERNRYPAVEGDEVSFSSTTTLLAPKGPGGQSRPVFLRMRCPRGGDPLMWMLWTWIGLSAAACVILLETFYIVDYV